MVRRIWPWAQLLQPSQPIIFALPPAPVSIASLASGGRFDMLMPSGALDSAEIILMLFFLTAALAAWIFTEAFFKRKSVKKRGSYLGGVVCVFNHPSFPFSSLHFSSITAASHVNARPRELTRRALAFSACDMFISFMYLFVCLFILFHGGSKHCCGNASGVTFGPRLSFFNFRGKLVKGAWFRVWSRAPLAPSPRLLSVA